MIISIIGLCILGVLGGVLIYVGVKELQLRKILQEKGKHTTGTVIEVTSEQSASRKSGRFLKFTHTFEYMAEGVRYTTAIYSDHKQSYAVGDTAKFAYLPENPKECTLADFLTGATANKNPLIYISLGLFVIAAGVVIIGVIIAVL